MGILQILIFILLFLVLFLMIFLSISLIQRKKKDLELTSYQKEVITFILQVNGVDDVLVYKYIDILSGKNVKKYKSLEHTVISKKIFNEVFDKIKNPSKLKVLSEVKSKLF